MYSYGANAVVAIICLQTTLLNGRRNGQMSGAGPNSIAIIVKLFCMTTCKGIPSRNMIERRLCGGSGYISKLVEAERLGDTRR